jgi:hypothetical protein
MTFDQEQLMNIPSDCSMKDMFDALKLRLFWLLVKNYFPISSGKAIKVLVTSFCDTKLVRTWIFCCFYHENENIHRG